jgi:predicted nucleotidyltransferase
MEDPSDTALEQRDRLVQQLRRALGQDPTLRLVVLHGSRARRNPRPDSDIDLVVDALDSDSGHLLGLAHLVQEACGVMAQVSRLAEEREAGPAMLLDVVDQGIAIIDREGAMQQLREQRPTIEQEAGRRPFVAGDRPTRPGLAHP